ncbi:uncharacterized protein LOC135503092 [Lineus longissimus]|uniref:uncharacterized protein LOC135503092 n=1 Tax=Lineus longissimus TaxID=88925 RepID=UPI002B4E2C95
MVVKCAAAMESMEWILMLACLLLVFSAELPRSHGYTDDEGDEDTDKLAACGGEAHVCQTLMRLVTGEVMDEQPYCECTECSTTWDQYDKRSLTWTHHERRDWTVQYRFCGDITPTRDCKNNETAFHLETDVKGWNPRVKNGRCRCPHSTYHLLGWRKVGSVWRYTYRCDKEICGKHDPCVKHYVNKNGKTTGYKFLCSCEMGYHCPTSHPIDSFTATEMDKNGDRFVYDYCELNVERRRRK